MHSDATGVYYTCNSLPQKFANNMLERLQSVVSDYPIVAVSHLPIFIAPPKNWTNIVVEGMERSHFNIYRQALLGAKESKTKYIFLLEDDCAYSPEHFKYRPKNKPFAYNFGVWNIFTWDKEPVFHFKGGGRINLGNLICEREAFIEAMEERFAKYPTPSDKLKDIWAEPGKYERQLGVKQQEFEVFYTNPPNIKFSHENELSFQGLGTRKRAGEIRATEIPVWGRADKIRALYE